MKELKGDPEPKNVVPNIAALLEQNAGRFPDKVVFAELKGSIYEGITWENFYSQVKNIAAHLKDMGFKKGSRMMIFSPNSLQMLELEMAVMGMGGVSIPVFAWFKDVTLRLLYQHSDATFLAVGGKQQLKEVDSGLTIDKLITLDSSCSDLFPQLVEFTKLQGYHPNSSSSLDPSLPSEEICLNMYTSGTMGVPKGVQLSHRNILSQQAALQLSWNLNETDRFLSYLPWHHSFGGIFERFSALYNGATLFLDSGYGKDPKILMLNWRKVKPTVFFSVPKVYQALVQEAHCDNESYDLLFRSGLKFIFTAAASLPASLSAEFERNGIPIMEGWGLTETSPCCTLTRPGEKREAGLVGYPISGVSIRLAEDNEILVKGPNVMKGYYKNDEANRTAFTNDGWFCTGDVGTINAAGLRLVSRKDRIFKLTNGEKVIPTEMEELIQLKCHYVMHAMVVGSGSSYPVAVIFPNRKMLNHPDFSLSPTEGCFCPRTLNELGKCLQGCLQDANCMVNQKFSRIKYAMIIDDELSIENSTLTPSMKMSPGKIQEAYKAHIENIYGSANPVKEDVYIVKLEPENAIPKKNRA